jgi:tetratricopeptide (TPR) repeat protein
VEHTLVLPEGRATQRTQCSEAAKVSLPLRKEIWRARGTFDAEAYVGAARACELPRWIDKRALLTMMIDHEPSGENRLSMARALEDAGENDAAQFVRRETLRRVDGFEQLEKLSRLLTEDEPEIDGELDRAYKKAQSDQARLEVVRNFLRLAPHNALARRRELALLEALGQKDALLQQITTLRSEAFVDAGLLSNGASALGRLGLRSESLRTFGDLIERAPRDPWTLAYVGDRLRAEAMFDEAGAAYDRLARTLPEDAGVMLRLALAHAGAGRLDVATRLLERVTQSGGRDDDGRVGELASITRAVLLAEARQTAEGDVKSRLTRHLLETPLPDVKSVVLVQWPPADDPIEVRIRRGAGRGELRTADFEAASVGLAAVRIERGDDTHTVLLRRPEDPGPSRPRRAAITALLMNGDRTELRVIPREIQVAADGKSVELEFDGENFP